MAEITLNIKVVGSQVNNGNFQMKGIPSELWDAFCSEATVLMPDKGESAWSEVFISIILSIVKAKERVILMNEIPDFVYEATEMVCREANSSIQELLKEILESASNKNFYLGVVKETDEDEKTATLVFTGVPLKTIGMFADIADFHAKQQKLKDFGAIDFLTKLFAQNSDNVHFTTASPDSIKDTHTFIVSNIPNASYTFWENIATNYKLAYKEASKNEIQANAISMVATMLLNSGTEQVQADFKVTKNQE